MAVDPDVDRLAILDEDGRPVGEDYTLAFAVRAVLAQADGVVTTNLSTSLVVDDAAKSFGARLVRAPVGEANVAHAMKASGAIIGGEGNGGVMLPQLHLGRDAPVAAALVLDLLGQTGQSVAQLVSSAPKYCIVKAKANRCGQLDEAYEQLKTRFSDAEIDLQDGLRLTWPESWLHVRPSGTEPIVRFIAEAHDEKIARELIEIARATLDRT
jgi:phosphomannomutase